MFARRFATLVGFVVTCLAASAAPNATAPERSVTVYVRASANQPAEILKNMRREVSALMLTAGYRVDWRDARDGGDVTDAPLVILELRGSCAVPDSPLPAISGNPSLASTAIVNGEVLPFAWVECDTLSRLLGPSLLKSAGLAGDDRGASPRNFANAAFINPEFLYGRAMGRLAAHEMYHILTKTREHESSGIAKTSFSAKDILAARFPFDFAALAKLREPAAGDDDVADGDEATGR